MAHVLSDRPATAIAAEDRHDAVIAALEVHGAVIAMQAAYENWLRERIFPLAPLADRKKERTLQHTLLSQQTMPILQYIWKESPHISDEQLNRLGLSRTFSESSPLNCWALADKLQSEGESFGKTLATIRRVVNAAAHFKLVNRKRLSANCNRISGSPLLHEMMMELAAQDFEILEERVGWPTGEGGQ